MARALGAGARAGVVLAVAAALGAAALGAAFAGVRLCLPAALPGDEGWFLRHLAGEALALVTGQGPVACPLGPGGGETLLAAVAPLRALALAVPAVALLWELAGWRLRLALMRRKGGHAVLAGPAERVEPLAPAACWRLWLVPEGAAGAGSWPLPRLWRHRLPMAGGAAQAGLGRAALVVAAAQDDLANYRLARRALEEGCCGRLVVQIESRALRGLGAEALRAEAERRGVRLTVVAPHVLQAREAVALAMPGRYRDDAAGGAWHLGICGDGAGVDDLIARLARQGYGLERRPPRLSVLRVSTAPGLRTGTPPDLPSDIAPGGLPGVFSKTLSGAHDLVDLAERAVPAEDPDRIDAEIARTATGSVRLSAVFCVSATPGVAVLLARRWERVLADLGLPVPPLVALDEEEPEDPAAGGFALVAACPRLDGIEAREARLDARARAVHAHYLGLIGGAAAAAGLPSQRPWSDLPERYREDNRAAADHLPYKLARAGLALAPTAARRGLSAVPAALIEPLAEIEHARWMAARRVAGWTRGPRDDAAQTHPDLVPYADLDEPARDKDRDQVARLPALVALGGEALLREWPVRIGRADARAAVAAVAALGQRHPDRAPVLHGALEAGDLAVLAAVQSAGHLTALVTPGQWRHDDWTALARDVRRKAHRLHVAEDPQAVLAALPCLETAMEEEAEHAILA
jgi:hypothetical protein